MPPRLTIAEHNIIRFPPGPRGWLCIAKRVRDDGEKVICNTPNAGSKRTCWLCCKPRTTTSKALWPIYEAACKKAGLEPTGKRQTPPGTQAQASVAPTKRRGRR